MRLPWTRRAHSFGSEGTAVRWPRGWRVCEISSGRTDSFKSQVLMTVHPPPNDESEHLSLAEIRLLQAENAAAIQGLIAAQRENAQAIERLSKAISGLRNEQVRTSNDVSTLKGWGLENLCDILNYSQTVLSYAAQS